MQAERRRAAILAARIVGTSRPIAADEAGTLAAVKGLRLDVIDLLLAERRGRIVRLMGDGALVEFAAVADAVACAVAIQRYGAVRQAKLAAERRIAVRIGIDLGNVTVEDDDLFGDAVAVATHLERRCEPGGVLISGTAHDQLEGRLSLRLEALDEQRSENAARPVRAYRVRMDDRAPARPPQPKVGRRGMAVIGLALLAALLASLAATASSHRLRR
jgi:class 3 adenylate cyclase